MQPFVQGPVTMGKEFGAMGHIFERRNGLCPNLTPVRLPIGASRNVEPLGVLWAT